MIPCSTEFHDTVDDNFGRPVRRDWVCPESATHAEQDELDPNTEYLVCRRCAAIAEHFGFKVRDLTEEELNDSV